MHFHEFLPLMISVFDHKKEGKFVKHLLFLYGTIFTICSTYVCIILHQKCRISNMLMVFQGENSEALLNAADCSCSLMDFISEWT